MKQNSTKQIFRMNQIGPGTQVNGAMSNGGSQPPRNRIVVNALISIMLAYSPRKNSAKLIEEYSTKKPATISLSPSGRSNGARLVSARIEMKNMMNIGNSGMQNQCRNVLPCCASTMSVRFRLPATSSTQTMMKPIETS